MPDRYECPYHFEAEAIRFESLQCAIRACAGLSDESGVQDPCIRCADYLPNARHRDLEDLSQTVP